MCQNCSTNRDSGSSSSFLFGLLLGAAIGAVIAIVIYKNDKDRVLKMLKTKIDDFLKNILPDQASATKTRPTKRRKIKYSHPLVVDRGKPAPVVSALAPSSKTVPPRKFFKPAK